MNQPLLKNTLTRVCVLTAIELALRSRICGFERISRIIQLNIGEFQIEIEFSF